MVCDLDCGARGKKKLARDGYVDSRVSVQQILLFKFSSSVLVSES